MTRRTVYGRTHRVGATWPDNSWNPSCDRQDRLVAIPLSAGNDIRPPRRGDLTCDRPECAA